MSRATYCSCPQCMGFAPDDDLDDELAGKQIARAAEPDIDQPTDCD